MTLRKPAPDSMAEWDKMIAPYLRIMERNANHILERTRDISTAVALVGKRPEFVSLAEDAMEKSVAHLDQALADLREALAAYRSKPVHGRRLEAAE